jgi:hypothetical protein
VAGVWIACFFAPKILPSEQTLDGLGSDGQFYQIDVLCHNESPCSLCTGYGVISGFQEQGLWITLLISQFDHQ